MAITVTNAASTTERLPIKRARKPKLREDVSEEDFGAGVGTKTLRR